VSNPPGKVQQYYIHFLKMNCQRIQTCARRTQATDQMPLLQFWPIPSLAWRSYVVFIRSLKSNRMKKRVLLVALILAATITTSIIRANSSRILIYYKDNVITNFCNSGTFLPETCVPAPFPQICTLTTGDYTRDFYQTSSCTIPYYRYASQW